MSHSENISLFILFILYSIQGLIINFFVQTLPIFLVEKGAQLSEIAIMNMLVLPFSLKLFFAPFIDFYFSKSFGKRKSYIVPTNYAISILLIGSSFHIESLVDEQNLTILSIIGFITIFPLSIQDVAVDGLGADLFKGEKSIYPAVAQTVGISFGSFLASNVLVMLNSKNFCNNYIFLEEKNEGLLKISHFLCFFGFLLLLINIYIHFFMNDGKREDHESVREDEKEISLKDRIFSMKIFFTDRLLISYLLLLIFSRFPFSLMDSSFKLKLIQKGFPKEHISHILSMTMFFGVVFQFLLPKLLRKVQEINLFYWFFLIKLVENLISFLLIQTHTLEDQNSNIFLISLIVVSLISNIQYNASHGLFGSISTKLSQKFEKGFEGTNMAFLTSIFNLGRRFSDYFALSIIEKYDFSILIIGGWCLGSLILLSLRSNLLILERNLKKMEKSD